MNDEQVGHRADYILGRDGNLARNAEGDAVIVNYMKALEAQEQLQKSWAGAYVAGLLREHPWVESMAIELKASGEYDDDGGTYRSIRASVINVILRSDVRPPVDAIVDGEFDPDFGAALIEPSLDDACGDLYDAFHPECDDYNDIVVTVERRSVVQLLEHDQVNGTDAFVRLFPDHVQSDMDQA